MGVNKNVPIEERWFTDTAYKRECLAKAGRYEGFYREEDWDRWFNPWRENGYAGNPPELFKHMRLEDFGRRYRLRVLVETGTCFGAAAKFNKDNFDRIYTVENNTYNHDKSSIQLEGLSHVRLVLGDSKVVISQFLSEINEPALFWLDSNHRETLFTELECIFNHHVKNHIILIDDVRLFGHVIDNITTRHVLDHAKKYKYGGLLKHDSIQLKKHDFYYSKLYRWWKNK
jgi:hypothetical protein